MANSTVTRELQRLLDRQSGRQRSTSSRSVSVKFLSESSHGAKSATADERNADRIERLLAIASAEAPEPELDVELIIPPAPNWETA